MVTYLYGTGTSCKNLLCCRVVDIDCITGFIETKKTADKFNDKPVLSVNEIENYDYILVTVKDNSRIYDACMQNNIDLNRVCFFYPCLKDANSEKNLKIAKNILTDTGLAYILNNYKVASDEWIREDAEKYQKMNKRESFAIQEKYNYYISYDKFSTAGSAGSYFWQDLWAAKEIIKRKPGKHYDIGSRVDGFIAHLLSAGINTCLIDVRPLDLKVDNLEFVCADATNLETIDDDSIESLSALCSLEHFGLGRYGDPIDPEACFKCFKSIQKKLKKGGDIYISVPVGKEHIEFNAHRIFYARTILENFDECELVEYSGTYNSLIEKDIDIGAYDYDDFSRGARFGLFHFMKK